MNNPANYIQNLSVAKRKIQMSGLIYELNRLQFATIAAAKMQKNLKNFTDEDAVNLILEYVPKCLKEIQPLLTADELSAICSYCVVCLLTEVNPNFIFS